MLSLIAKSLFISALIYSIISLNEMREKNGIGSENAKATDLFISLGSEDYRSEQCIEEILETEDDYSELWAAKNIGLGTCSVSHVKAVVHMLPIAIESYFRPELTMAFAAAGISMSAKVDTLNCKDAVKIIEVLCPITVGHARIGW